MDIARSLFSIHQLEMMTKQKNEDDIVITTEGNEIIAEGNENKKMDNLSKKRRTKKNDKVRK